MRIKHLLLLFIFVVFVPLISKVIATEYITFFVYHQRNFSQGYWIHANKLGDSESYLEVSSHEDLMGSEKIDLAYKIIEILQKDKPEIYSFLYELNLSGDSTVLISFEAIPENWTLIRNELTASFLTNGFSLILDLPNLSIKANFSDLNIPYFDLKDNNVFLTKDLPLVKPVERIVFDTCSHEIIEEPAKEMDSDILDSSESELKKYGITFWWIIVALFLSVLANLYLLLNWFFKKN